MLKEFKNLHNEIIRLKNELSKAENDFDELGTEIFYEITKIRGWDILLSNPYHKELLKKADNDPSMFKLGYLEDVSYEFKDDQFIMYEVYDSGATKKVLSLDVNKDLKGQVIELIEANKKRKNAEKEKRLKQKAYEDSMRPKFDEQNKKLISMGMTPYPDFNAWLKQQKQTKK